MGHPFCLLRRNLCPCVLKYEDNSTELASLVDLNKKYQVRRERALSCTDLLCVWLLRLERECAKVIGTPTGCEVTSDQFVYLRMPCKVAGTVVPFILSAIEPGHRAHTTKSQFLPVVHGEWVGASDSRWETLSTQWSLEDSVREHAFPVCPPPPPRGTGVIGEHEEKESQQVVSRHPVGHSFQAFPHQSFDKSS